MNERRSFTFAVRQASLRLCTQCLVQRSCRDLRARIVTDAELSDPNFLLDLKAYVRALGLSGEGAREELSDRYRDYPGRIVDSDGRDAPLDMEVFEFEGFRYWLRDFLAPVASGTRLRVRREAWERVRVLATLLRALDPVSAAFWGVRAANDVKRQPTLTRSAGCPAKQLIGDAPDTIYMYPANDL